MKSKVKESSLVTLILPAAHVQSIRDYENIRTGKELRKEDGLYPTAIDLDRVPGVSDIGRREFDVKTGRGLATESGHLKAHGLKGMRGRTRSGGGERGSGGGKDRK